MLLGCNWHMLYKIVLHKHNHFIPAGFCGIGIIAQVHAIFFGAFVSIRIGKAVFGAFVHIDCVLYIGVIQLFFSPSMASIDTMLSASPCATNTLAVNLPFCAGCFGVGLPWKVATALSGKPSRAMSKTILPPKQNQSRQDGLSQRLQGR